MTQEPRCWAGIDTHTQFHVIAVIDDRGHVIDTMHCATEPAALILAVDWLAGHAPAAVGIEGTSSYGASITRLLQLRAITVWEVTAPNKVVRRNAGKSDTIDAIQAAEAARTGQRLSPVKNLTNLPRLRALNNFRSSAVSSRTQVGNQIQATARGRGTPVGSMSAPLARRLLNDPDLALPAQRWLNLNDEVRAYDKQITAWLRQWAPRLLARTGIGPCTATQLILTAGGNPDRLTSEAAFARLCGAAPVPCSSGNRQQHYRLSRGGDRAANAALWRIAFHRYHDPKNLQTQAYKAHREAHNDTERETIRRIKRALVREVLPDLRDITKALSEA